MKSLYPLTTQEAAMQKWVDQDSVEVSVICLCYNQENYIEQTIQSLLMQRTNFAFEIIIHDDASTDGTASIVTFYAEQYPDIIRPILQTTNQYSRHRSLPIRTALAASHGKYIAICEGDDYYISPDKLRAQFDVLEENSEINFCFHSIYKEYDGRLDEEPSWRKRNRTAHIEFCAEQMMLEFFVQATAFFIRKSAVEAIPEYVWDMAPSADDFMAFFAMKSGGGIYIDRPMSVYRVEAKGSWSATAHRDYLKMVEHYCKKTEVFKRIGEQWPELELPVRRANARILYTQSIDCLKNRNYFKFKDLIEESNAYQPSVCLTQVFLFRLRNFRIVLLPLLLLKEVILNRPGYRRLQILRE